MENKEIMRAEGTEEMGGEKTEEEEKTKEGETEGDKSENCATCGGCA